jgi:hypothetical protein
MAMCAASMTELAAVLFPAAAVVAAAVLTFTARLGSYARPPRHSQSIRYASRQSLHEVAVSHGPDLASGRHHLVLCRWVTQDVVSCRFRFSSADQRQVGCKL